MDQKRTHKAVPASLRAAVPEIPVSGVERRAEESHLLLQGHQKWTHLWSRIPNYEAPSAIIFWRPLSSRIGRPKLPWALIPAKRKGPKAGLSMGGSTNQGPSYRPQIVGIVTTTSTKTTTPFIETAIFFFDKPWPHPLLQSQGDAGDLPGRNQAGLARQHVIPGPRRELVALVRTASGGEFRKGGQAIEGLYDAC